MAINFLTTLAASAVGGGLFFYLCIPLPWMLGPLSATLLLGWLRPGRVCWPPAMQNAGQLVLGYLLGRPFTAEVGIYILSQLPLMLVMTVFLIVFSLAAGYVTHRQTGLSLATSVLGTVPGGLTQMVILSGEIAGADTGIVTIMQTLRMLSVVFTVPFLAIHGFSPAGPAATAVPATIAGNLAGVFPFVAAVACGAWLAVRLKFPTPYLLGPVLATAPLVISGLPAPAVPPLLLTAAQICVGTYMGSTIHLAGLGNWRKILLSTLLNIAVLLVASLFIGYILAGYIPTSLVTAFLSASPGGMTEMGLTAVIVGADVSVVVGYQIFRLLFILLVLPIFLRYWLVKGKERRP
jgi:membrane protein AbrB duplication